MQEKHRFLSFAREIASVVIGILIAVFINNWNQDLKNQRFVNRMLYAIGEEIKFSHADVSDTYERHIQQMDSIQKSMSNNSESIVNLLIRIGGLQNPERKNIGLRFFVNHHAELIDYRLISDLSEVEFSSINLEKKVDRLIQFMLGEMDRSDVDAKKKLMIYFSDVLDSERSLLKKYEEILRVHAEDLQVENREE